MISPFIRKGLESTDHSIPKIIILSRLLKDILIGAVNVKDVNMRQYGKPKSTAYSVENMITVVKIIYQQELGVVKCLASRKDKAKKSLYCHKEKWNFQGKIL